MFDVSNHERRLVHRKLRDVKAACRSPQRKNGARRYREYECRSASVVNHAFQILNLAFHGKWLGVPAVSSPSAVIGVYREARCEERGQFCRGSKIPATKCAIK